jgi:hypothetical protein
VVVDHRRQQVVRRGDGVEIAGEVQVHFLHRHDLRMPPPAAPPFMPKFGPSEASRMQIMAFLPIRLRPSPRPTVVVVLPSPAGVGLIAVTRISLPSACLSAGLDEVGRNLGLVMAVGQQIFARDAELGADLLDRFLVRRAGDFDVGLE